MKVPKGLGTIFSKFIYQLQPKTKTLVRKLERILKVYRQNLSLLFNQTCLNEGLLSNYTHTHTQQLDTNKMAGEAEKEARRQLHKNVGSNIEQVLVATPNKAPNYTATCLPSQKLSKLDEPDMQDTAGEAGDELISDVLLWTPTYGRAKAGRPARTYIQQLSEDTGCSLEDLPEAMNKLGKSGNERVRGISV